jgi:hypothetical protein
MSMSVSLTSYQAPVAPVPKVTREKDEAKEQVERQTEVNVAKASSESWKTSGTTLDIRV